MGPRHPPFGLPSQSTGGAVAGSTTQPIQWSSEFYDSELALVYYNYRHYNPVDGRWIVRDAIHEALIINYTYFPVITAYTQEIIWDCEQLFIKKTLCGVDASSMLMM